MRSGESDFFRAYPVPDKHLILIDINQLTPGFMLRRVQLSIYVRVRLLGSVTAVEALKAMRVRTVSLST